VPTPAIPYLAREHHHHQLQLAGLSVSGSVFTGGGALSHNIQPGIEVINRILDASEAPILFSVQS
jgi:hypothetical protein